MCLALPKSQQKLFLFVNRGPTSAQDSWWGWHLELPSTHLQPSHLRKGLLSVGMTWPGAAQAGRKLLSVDNFEGFCGISHNWLCCTSEVPWCCQSWGPCGVPEVTCDLETPL